MRISIITVVYNGAATIRTALDSVAKQSHDDIEHIVVDGASTDNTVAIVRDHRPAVSRLISEPDRGMYDAMNKGIALATGEVIGILNSDDLYANETVLTKVSKAFADERLDVTYGDLVYVQRERTQRVVRYWRPGAFEPRRLRRGWFPPHPTLFVRQRTYTRCGTFNLDFPLAADVELMVRFFAKYQVRSAYIPEVLVKMRLGGVSNSRLSTIVRQNIAIRRAARQYGLALDNLFVYSVCKLADRLGQLLVRP